MTRQDVLAQTKQLADLWYEQYTPMLLAKQVIERKKRLIRHHAEISHTQNIS